MLRYPEMQRRLRLRSSFVSSLRNFLVSGGFVDVDTPTLFRSTPGGAQEFVVPTRVPGRFYSLVQSPQQFKQLLMVGGLDRYFQVARCYRDEGARPDRQPEFTQVDIELSFTSTERVKNLVEELLRSSWPDHLPAPPVHFPTISHAEAMEKYGSDKPDLRYDNEICNLSDSFKKCQDDLFVAKLLKTDTTVIKGISFLPEEGRAVPSNQLKKLESEVVSLVKERYPGEDLILSGFSANDKGELKSSLLKKCPDELTQEVISRLNVSEGSVGFLACGDDSAVSEALGQVRAHLGKMAFDLDPLTYSFLWVQDFPLFEKNNEGYLVSSHHPFTRPVEEDLPRLFSDPLSVRGEHYDLVLNGHEVAGGSIRIHESDMQKKILQDLLHLDPDEFSHLLEALDYGCPPHGGVAIGLDRLIAVMLGVDGVRDVMAFPKTQAGRDPMSDAPSKISQAQLDLYHLRVSDTNKLKQNTEMTGTE